MPSNSGSPEPPDSFTADMARGAMEKLRREHYSPEPPPLDPPMGLTFRLQRTDDEIDRIADGEPYCFRCGKPASSFGEYRDEDLTDAQGVVYSLAAAYVRREEGTYNPETNRFACDACYIAIGMPVGPLGAGWQAP